MPDQGPLIIFDLDGLLVDTERLFYRAFKAVAKKRYHKTLDFVDYVREVVSAGREITEVLDLSHAEAEALRQAVYGRYRSLLQDVRLREGAVECLNRLRNFECVLVTGSKKEFCDIILDKLSLRQFFKTVITRDDGFPRKPDPSVFQHLMTTYGRSQLECLVVEDSLRGITAALALNMPCIYVPTDYTHSEEISPRVRRLKSLVGLTEAVIFQVLDEWKPNPDHTVVNLYRDSAARLKDTFSVYCDIYGLNEYRHTDREVTSAAFDYARKRSFFVILIVVTTDGKVYFHRSFDTGHLTMVPPGGALHLEENDTILDAINRIANLALNGAKLADVAPIIHLRNVFECKDGRSIEHIGLGVRALLLNEGQEVSKYENDISVKGAFLRDFPASEIPQDPARETYKKFVAWHADKHYSPYLNEISTQHEVLWRYRLHQLIVNPTIVRLSRFVGEHSIPYVKRQITERIGSVMSLLDVACGDDKGVFDFLRHVRLVVANDISVDQIKALEEAYNERRFDFPKAHTILFTNHDCLDLPFRDNAFEAALCRNLLHHMKTASDLAGLLANIRRVSKRILIVEIEDPAFGTWWDKIRHKYYLDWLRDEGEHFYAHDDFQTVISRHFRQDQFEFRYFHTVRGTYMMAEIRKRSSAGSNAAG